MRMNRRDFLAVSAAAVATARCGNAPASDPDTRADKGPDSAPDGGSDRVPVLGLIFPPADRGIPEEGTAMYGDRLKYVVTGLGVERMTPEGFDAVMERIPAAAKKLA